MSIVIEMTRKQVFTGEIEPYAFVRTALSAETISNLAREQLCEIADTYNAAAIERLKLK